MSLITNLNLAAANGADLNDFIGSHIAEIYDHFIWSTDASLADDRNDFEDFVISRRISLTSLQKTNQNLAFLTLLLDASERLGLISAFNYLYRHLKSANFTVGSRLDAAAIYIKNTRDVAAIFSRFDQFYELLQFSFLEEEDNVDKILTTVVNFYSRFVIDFGQYNQPAVLTLKSRLSKSLEDDEYSFLHHPLIYKVLETDTTDRIVANTHIHSLLDDFLHRGHTKGKEVAGFLEEAGTNYSQKLAHVGADFAAIRKLSVQQHMSNPDADRARNSLNRGTAVIEREDQLCCYFHSYGNMHHEKLMEAFNELPADLFEKRVNLIDWGCGQAMASLTYIEYCYNNNIEQNIDKIILIEPSEPALRRGALHVKKFLPDANIATVNKYFDNLKNDDFEVKTGVNVHLLSNVVDMDKFSIGRMVTLIQESCGGKNYFVVVSPYVDDLIKAKLASFRNLFSKNKNFEQYQSIAQKAREWKASNDWTRISIVFSADLNFSASH